MGEDGAASSDDEIVTLRISWTFIVGLVCTLAVYWINKAKREPTDATRRLEQLWGIQFKPFTEAQKRFLAGGAVLGLIALFTHALLFLGPGAFIIVVGLVSIVLRKHGILQQLSEALRKYVKTVFNATGASNAKVSSTVDMATSTKPLPVWVITGFLGSGKTTLVNRLVKSKHMRLLVVTNEAGDTALDAELIMECAKNPESVLLVNNGCACCKVRGDLCDLLRDQVLGARGAVRGNAEGVIIECSGLADPRAVAQTFLLDEDLKTRLELREVVAVADAANIQYHLSTEPQKSNQRKRLARLVEEQIAFASLVLLNKADCTDGATLLGLARSIDEINRTVEVVTCTYCDVDVLRILGTTAQATPIPAGKRRQPVGAWSPDRALIEIENVKRSVASNQSIGEFSEEKREGPQCSPCRGGAESEAESIRCLSVRIDGELDLDAFNRWVLRTLQDFSILRAKGVLAARGHDEKLAFQAVHSAFHGTPSLAVRWKPGEPRFSQVVVIGIEVPADLIEYGLRRCLSDSKAAGSN